MNLTKKRLVLFCCIVFYSCYHFSCSTIGEKRNRSFETKTKLVAGLFFYKSALLNLPRALFFDGFFDDFSDDGDRFDLDLGALRQRGHLKKVTARQFSSQLCFKCTGDFSFHNCLFDDRASSNLLPLSFLKVFFGHI